MELTGTIIAVMEAKTGKSSRTGNPWMKQEYVIEMLGQYPRHCAFSIFGEDRIKQLNIQNGEELTIQFDIDAHEYNGRWYNEEELEANNDCLLELGIDEIDEFLRNNELGEIFTIVGDSGSGRSSLTIRMVDILSVDRQIPTLFLCCRESPKVIIERLVNF